MGTPQLGDFPTRADARTSKDQAIGIRQRGETSCSCVRGRQWREGSVDKVQWGEGCSWTSAVERGVVQLC